MPDLHALDSDDRRFLAIVSNVVDAVPDKVRDLWVIRIDNWFDHKWLRFSGIGRVPFEMGWASHPGVALDEFSQDQLTFPPFTPKRVLRQDLWTAESARGSTLGRLPHPRILRPSADNLHRRVSDFSDSMAAIWFSSRSEENGQGSVMQYRAHEGKTDAWYASFRLHGASWRLHSVKGLDRAQAEAFASDLEPPESGPRER